MNGRFVYFIGLLALLCWFPDSLSFSGEAASITATAYVLPAVGIEENSNAYPAGDTDPGWLLRCPPSGSIICRIEINKAISDYCYNNKENRQIALPAETILDEAYLNSADSCIITIIYSEN